MEGKTGEREGGREEQPNVLSATLHCMHAIHIKTEYAYNCIVCIISRFTHTFHNQEKRVKCEGTH